MVPEESEVKLMNSILDKRISIDMTRLFSQNEASSPLHTPEIETADDQVVNAAESPNRRYSSPLFQNLFKSPVEAVKISKPSIPDDNSIHNLLYTANLVSKTQKPSEITINADVDEKQALTPTNTPDSSLSEEVIDENLFNKLSVPEKRPSVHDPEKVLMENVVPGENHSHLSLNLSLNSKVYLV